MNFEAFLEQTADELGLASMVPNEDGVAHLVAGDSVTVLIERSPVDQGSLVIYSLVGSLPAVNREAFMEKLLQEQLFGVGVGAGVCFGLAGDSGEVLLNKTVSMIQRTPRQLVEELEAFAYWAEHWTKKLSSEQQTTGSSGEAISGHFVRI